MTKFEDIFLNTDGMDDLFIRLESGELPGSMLPITVSELVMFHDDITVVDGEVMYKDTVLCDVYDISGNLGKQVVGYILFERDCVGKYVPSVKYSKDLSVKVDIKTYVG